MTRVTETAVVHFLPPLWALFHPKQGDVSNYPTPTASGSSRHWKVVVTKSWHCLPDGEVPRWLLPITQLTEPVTLPSYRQTENRAEWKNRKKRNSAQFGLLRVGRDSP